MKRSSSKTPALGRPPKFREASRPITVTLPERILRSLSGVSEDRAQAIVKCVEAATVAAAAPRKLVELARVGPNKALIVVGPSRLLRRIPWLRMVEIAPTRFLLILPPGTPVERLEVAVFDLLDNMPAADEGERALLQELRTLISGQRRKKTVTAAELVLIDAG